MPDFTARRKFLRFLAASPLLSVSGQENPIISDPAQALNVFDLEPAARKFIPPAHFGYLATGVDDDRTVRENHEAYSRIHLRPRRLVDVSRIDTTVDLFDTKWATPIFICPCGAQKAYHPEGDLATFLENYSRNGGTHHAMLVFGDRTEELEKFAQLAGIPAVRIG